MKGKARQPCGCYSSRWCRSWLLGSLFLTGQSQGGYCHMLNSKPAVTHRGCARSTAHLQADSAVHAQQVWHIQMLHRLPICKGHLYSSSQAVEHPEIRNGCAAFGSVNGRRDGGSSLFFPIKSPPALSQGDKSTALFPQDAFSGMWVCSWRYSVCRANFLFLVRPCVRHLKIIVNPDLYICTYIPVPLVWWPFSYCLCRGAMTAKSWSNHLNRDLFQNNFLNFILLW